MIFIEIFLLISAFILFLISNKETFDFLIREISKKYEISYKKTSGTLLTGIVLEDVKYKNTLLAKEIVLDWKITPLFYKKLSFEKIKINKLNFSTLNRILKNKKTKKDKKSLEIWFLNSLDIDKLYFLGIDFINRNLKIKKLYIEADKIQTNFKDLKISNFKIDLKSNIANAKVEGLWENKNIYLNILKIKNLDIDKLTTFLNQKKKKEASSNILINGIILENLFINTKPFTYKNYKIDKIELNGESGFFDLKYLYLDTLNTIIDSNLGYFNIKGKIDKNRLFAKSEIRLKNNYFKKYSKNINFTKIYPINANFELNNKVLRATIFLKAKDFLKNNLSKYEIEIKNSKTVLSYLFKNKIFKSKTSLNLKSLYFEDLNLLNNLDINRSLKLKGEIECKKFQNIPQMAKELLNNLKIYYNGNNKKIKGEILSSKIKGEFNLEDFKTLYLNIKTKMENIKSKITLKSKINLKNPKLSKIFVNLKNPYINTDSVLKLSKNLEINSILTPINKKLSNLKIFPVNLKTTLKKDKIVSKIEGKALKGEVNYNLNSKDLNSTIDISTSKVYIKGNIEKNISLNAKIPSIRELKNQILPKYKNLPIDGELFIKSSNFIKNMQSKTKIYAKWLLYEYKKNRFLVAEKLKTNLKISPKKIEIKNYSFNILDKKFFSNKQSDIFIKNSKIEINSLFINNKGVLKGVYNLKKDRGNFNLTAKNFNVKTKEIKSVFDTKISMKSYKNKKDIEGFIKLHSAKISYYPSKTYKIQDKDIIILQRVPKKETKKSLTSINIRIFSKKPIFYDTKEIKATFKPDITIWKEYKKDTEILGMVKILKGSVKKEDKIFKIDGGELLFGGDPLNPYLNIKLLYFKNPYQITITITGSLQSPIVLFSSEPYLSQSDILSLILFGTTSNNLLNKENSSSSKLISFFGNTLAKELVKNLGIKLDRLALMTKENGSIGVEIGKKISKKVTIIYRNDTVSTLLIQIEHSPKFETDITIKPNSSGIDFIYKKEY